MVSTTSRPEDANEAHVRAGFWPKIRATIAYIPFAEDALAAALRMIASHMKPEHREAAKRAVDRLAGK
jgi:uncharacterized membrane protein YkvA (DUF1232 family)